MKKNILGLVCAFIFSQMAFFYSCSNNSIILFGKYNNMSIYKGLPAFVTEICLNPDSTFTYQYSFDQIYRYSKGIFVKNNNTIFLLSNINDVKNIEFVTKSKFNIEETEFFYVKNNFFEMTRHIDWFFVSQNYKIKFDTSMIKIHKKQCGETFIIEGIPNGTNRENAMVNSFCENDTVKSVSYTIGECLSFFEFDYDSVIIKNIQNFKVLKDTINCCVNGKLKFDGFTLRKMPN